MRTGRSWASCATNSASMATRPIFATCSRAWPTCCQVATARRCTTCSPPAGQAGRQGGRPAAATGQGRILMTAPRMPPAIRVKSHWFKAGASKTPEEHASAMAFIVWRGAQHAQAHARGAIRRRCRRAVLRVHARSAGVPDCGGRPHRTCADGSGRALAFTTALVRHCADTLADNETELLGPQADGASYGDQFIDLVNEVTQHYAEFGADPRPQGRRMSSRPTSLSCAIWAAGSSRPYRPRISAGCSTR